MMCFRSTLLPLPDPPRMTTDSPAAIARSSSSSTTLPENALRTFSSRISPEAGAGFSCRDALTAPLRWLAMSEIEPIDVPNDATLFDKVVNLCKRRGFVFQSAEIYGGFRSTYDYGPVGVLMLRNVKDAWWRSMVQLRDDIVGLDTAILSPPAVWEASGHLQNFTDPLVDFLDADQLSTLLGKLDALPGVERAQRLG